MSRSLMDSNGRIVRQYNIFNNQILCKISIDGSEVLSIVVDMENLQFSTSLMDCDLKVFSEESTILVNLVSYLNSGVC